MTGDGDQVWSVSELNAAVRSILENTLMPFWVRGEVGNLTIHRSGHVYMSLKDERCQVRVVYFNGAREARAVNLATGMEVEVFGNLSVYEVRGEYQFSARQLRPLGLGDLQRRFEELKKRLAAEGLFDESRKRPIPTLPRTIGLVTSPQGAAVRDFLRIIERRFPNIHIRVYPSAVQGRGAAKTLAAGLGFFNRHRLADVIVLTRGGGSLEDLWPFNEEELARAVAASDIPVISAVGHEIDFTISDFVADLRVPTPSAAAELVVGRREDFLEKLAACRRRVRAAMELFAARRRQRYERAANSRVFLEPAHLVRQRQQQVDELLRTLENVIGRQLERRRARLDNLSGRLRGVNPRAVLERGYAIVTDRRTGKTVMRAADVEAGAPLAAALAEGLVNMVAE